MAIPTLGAMIIAMGSPAEWGAFAIGAANSKLFVNAGATAPEWANGYKVLSTTHDVSATGTQAITGAGFKPSSGVIFATIDNTEGAAWGMFDSSKAIVALLANRSGAAGVYEPYSAICLYNADGSAAASFTITSLDADGLTITWEKIGSPTGTATIKLLLLR